MGKQKKTRKFAEMKRLLNPKDIKPPEKKIQKDSEKAVRHVDKTPTALFFKYNTQLGPPYQVLLDTNFINFTIKNKIDLVAGMMDCLYAECIPCITDCVVAELEKLGQKYRVALKVAKDPRIERIPCTHSGTYADDCICEKVKQHRCYIVATCDRDLRRRIRKVCHEYWEFLSEFAPAKERPFPPGQYALPVIKRVRYQEYPSCTSNHIATPLSACQKPQWEEHHVCEQRGHFIMVQERIS